MFLIVLIGAKIKMEDEFVDACLLCRFCLHSKLLSSDRLPTVNQLKGCQFKEPQFPQVLNVCSHPDIYQQAKCNSVDGKVHA